jgi:hypothetical protein
MEPQKDAPLAACVEWWRSRLKTKRRRLERYLADVAVRLAAKSPRLLLPLISPDSVLSFLMLSPHAGLPESARARLTYVTGLPSGTMNRTSSMPRPVTAPFVTCSYSVNK